MYKLKGMISGILFIFMFSGFTACHSDDDFDTGILLHAWKLTGKTVNGEQIDLSDCEKGELILFTSQNVCYLYYPCENKDIKTAWNYEDGNKIINIADLLPITWYLESSGQNILTIKYYAYSETGQLEKFTKQYRSAEAIPVDGKLRETP